ncbi:twin-arginine translocase TatA/TatE family subunit [Coraliomargarita algicola]|uniref:Sec-independent protein translocase protein TatA n=1 Tax=Coraliomargarita algicola TaxID=3092156 RepID=A0ABZ0RFC1_9BACT|nr:twin-arginine translocase TatA/TatE family subunit [Coraliomargarita sp. J2-16]WPJ94712.1 twin-arginine translocase TatA/TatE family subunit [Coraliomargarita sp. J2-16]
MNTLAFLENINGPEMIMIFLVVLLLFGAERLPGLFKSLGQSVREFKRATQGIEEDIRTAMDVESTSVSARPAEKAVAQAAPQATSVPEVPQVQSDSAAQSSESGEIKKAASETSPE